MSKKDAKINCSTFQKQEPAIEDITAKINSAEGVLGKAEFAKRLTGRSGCASFLPGL